MEIEVNGVRGEIESISSIGISIREDNGDIIIMPTNIMLKEKVRIIKS